MTQALVFLANAKSVSFELDGGGGDDVVQAVLRAAHSKSGDTHITVDMHLPVGTSDNGDVTGDIAEFETDGAGDVQGTIEAAGYRRAHLAARQYYDEREHRHGRGKPVVSGHAASGAYCGAFLLSLTKDTQIRRNMFPWPGHGLASPCKVS